jgi:hypothetical protein
LFTSPAVAIRWAMGMGMEIGGVGEIGSGPCRHLGELGRLGVSLSERAVPGARYVSDSLF